MYGKELIMDLYGCKSSMSRNMIERYLVKLCDLIEMNREDLHFWGYSSLMEESKAPLHLQGTSAIQFITTSNITIHTLSALREIYINLFSCKDFDVSSVLAFTKKFWKAENFELTQVFRGVSSKHKMEVLE